MARVGGKRKPGDLTASQVFSQRLVQVRNRHGWTQHELAERLRAAGEQHSQATIAKIEKQTTRAERVTLNEVLSISSVLDVCPLYMITPVDPFGPRLFLNREFQSLEPPDAWAWLHGTGAALPGQDPGMFALERPATEIAEALKHVPAAMVEQITASWQPPNEEE